MKSNVICGALGVILLLGAIPILARGVTLPNSSTEHPHSTVINSANFIELSYDEIVLQSTHIVDAEYLGLYSTDYGDELMFKPTIVYKGDIDTEDDVIYVQMFSDSEAQENTSYDVGGSYMLFLEKYSSVYYEHDKYVQLGQLYVAETDESWESYHKEMYTAMSVSRSMAPASYGAEFTVSTEIKDVLNISDNIFVVRVEDVYVESTKAPTTAYRCIVVKTIRNIPAQNGDIIITLFNDMVEIGGEYVVLLSDATETAPIYTLASRNSVYTWDEAVGISELALLLENATDYTAVISEQSDEDILREEQAAAQN